MGDRYFVIHSRWSEWQDLNLQPRDSKSRMLPIALHSEIYVFISFLQGYNKTYKTFITGGLSEN